MDKITSAIYNRKRNVKTVNSGTEERQSTWNVYLNVGVRLPLTRYQESVGYLVRGDTKR